MTIEQNIEKYYQRESIVKIITSYVLYYQVSLGHNVYESTQDATDTVKKIKELNLTIEPNEIMIVVMNIISQYSSQENFENNFDKYIQNRALLQSLEDFVKNDKELINGDRFIKYKTKEIIEGKYFNSNLKMQYLSEYPNMYKHYDAIIDNNYAFDVKNIIIDSLK
ncbi:MAG: hypothetical protein U9N59_15380 [Campylobacterota bacterium]|nr:hypothetical protein [Campylobacterota bacterium]